MATLTRVVEYAMLKLTGMVEKGVTAINQAFAKLDTKRQQSILGAAYREFAEKGYERASTNRMVEAADIGKGMLFYYFGSKEALYLHLIEEGIRFMLRTYVERLPEEETDYVEKMVKAGQVKQAVYAAHPEILNFMGKVYLEGVEMVPAELRQRMEEAREKGRRKLHANIDTRLFREDLPPERVMELIRWSLEGYEAALVERLRREMPQDMNDTSHWRDFYAFLQQLKHIYYKKGAVRNDGDAGARFEEKLRQGGGTAGH